MKRLLPLMDREKTFSVQTRILEGYEIAYKPFDINSALSGIAEREGFRLDVRAPQQIEHLRVVMEHAVLRRILAVHQFGKCNGKLFAELLDDAVIRHTLAVLPFGNRFIGHAERFRQLFLRQIFLSALLCDVTSDSCLIHLDCLLY